MGALTEKAESRIHAAPAPREGLHFVKRNDVVVKRGLASCPPPSLTFSAHTASVRLQQRPWVDWRLKCQGVDLMLSSMKQTGPEAGRHEVECSAASGRTH